MEHNTEHSHKSPSFYKNSTQPKIVRAVAIILALYALIEVGDCVMVCLMSLQLVANPYPAMLFSQMQTLFDSQPIWLVPLFLFFTSLRITSAFGLWRNRLWGFWLTLFVSLSTLIMSPFLLPFTAVEMLANGVIIMMLLIGYFGDAQIY